MIDLHSHTTLSDAVITPAAAIRYAKAAGYRALAITDHADASSMEYILRSLLPIVREYSLHAGIEVFAGVELTHVPAALIPSAIERARELGAHIVVVHGETLGDNVEPGTNHAAIAGKADILGHPGLITEEDAAFAAENGVFLEISTSLMHGQANGHVAALARKTGAKLLINNDAHRHSSFISKDKRRRIALGAGLSAAEADMADANAARIVSALLRAAT